MSLKSYLLPLLAILSVLDPGSACCTAWRHGSKPVRIADQEVLIIWDDEKGVEHFVRRAGFKSENSPKDFGFLVPTPTQPKLTEVPDRVFDELGKIIQPKVETKSEAKLSFMPLILAPLFATAEMAMKGSEATMARVEVLDTAIVGGFEVAVLRASETDALIAWLEKNDYDARPEIREWVGPYVEKEWIVTAFKYAGNLPRSSAPLTRASVCLSFETDAPFFPYRVPSDTRVAPQDRSLLRLYFAGRERVHGEFEYSKGLKWNASTKFSDRNPSMSGILKTVLSHEEEQSEIPFRTWLSAFEDETWPGGEEDLYFKTSSDQEAISPRAIIRAQVDMIHLPLDVILLCLLVAAYLYRRRVTREQESRVRCSP